jgi:hypothetical protein
MKIYRKKKILLIFILMFTFSCRDTRPIYREFSPPLENRELNINIQSDKEIEKILRAQWYQYDENKLSDSKTIISTTFQNSNNASQYSRYENSGLKYHLKFQDTRTLKIEIIEITYASLLLAFYTPAWDQEFNRPNISQYCVYSLLDQYIKFRNTALTMPGDRERCLTVGATEYLAKPFRLKHLRDVIQKMLKQAPGEK